MVPQNMRRCFIFLHFSHIYAVTAEYQEKMKKEEIMMKMILSYDSQSNSCAVDAVVKNKEAKEAFRTYLKKRVIELLCVTDNEAEELLEAGDAIEDGLSYNEETCAATICMPDGNDEVLNLVDAPELPVSDEAYYAKEEEKRAEDVIKHLKEEIGLTEDCDIPEKLKDSWKQTAEAAVHIFDRISGFNEYYWDMYWEMIRNAAEQAKKQLFSYEFELNISDEYKNFTDHSEWGAAFVWFDNGVGAEYNFCIQNGKNSSAIYRMRLRNGEWDTDYSDFRHYEIRFEDPDWAEALKKEMHDFAASSD